jgi:hypothetical protein
MRRARILAALIATTTAVVAVGAVASPANAAGTSAAAAASAVSQATAAHAGTAVTPTRTAGAPARLGQGITIGSGDLQLRVNTGSGQQSALAYTNGRTVYGQTEKSTSTVVQDHAGATQILKVIDSASAPTQYAFHFDLADGMRLLAGTQGVIIESHGDVVGYIDAPWAVDATGASVPTSYQVRGDTLIQTVAHKGAAYPVVADPSIGFGRYWYVRYNRSEVARVNVRIAEAGNAAGISLMCGMITTLNAALGAACGGILGSVAASVAGQVRDAQRAGQCILHRYTIIAPVLVAWERYNC